MGVCRFRRLERREMNRIAGSVHEFVIDECC